jgi:DNA replication protein DnaC
MSRLTEQLCTIGLRHTAASLDDTVALATRKRWSPTQLLEYIAENEESDRTRRSLQRRLARSRIGRFKPMADFDWSWPKKIDRDAVEAALRVEFLKEAGNLLLVAPQGLGKTMIAKNVAYQAVLAGHSVHFVTAAELLLDLGAQDSTRTLDARLKHYSRAALLVIDEIGFLSYDNRNADLLFQVVSRRYEKKSLILTTNLSFSQWSSIFPNATCTTALIDRLIHHAEIIAIEGDSFRRREAEAAQKTRRNTKGG